MLARIYRFSFNYFALSAQKWYLEKIQITTLKTLIIRDLYYVIRNPGQCHSIEYTCNFL